MTRWRCATIAALVALSGVQAQLRPRRVGTNALGEQEVVLTDVDAGDAAAADPMAGMANMAGMADGIKAMQDALSGGGEGLAEMLKNVDLENNPMLKAMQDANPELASEMNKMLSDPEALQTGMQQFAKLMGSPEAQDMAGNIMKEMQSVMTDPEKLKAGLEQLGSNPALKGLADAVPGLKEVLADPEALQEQAAKAAELFANLQDPEKAQEMLGSLGASAGGDVMENLQNMLGNMGGLGGDGEGGLDADAMAQAMQRMAGLMGGGEDGGDLLGGLGGGLDGFGDDEEGGGSGDDLKARVREQMAQMMNKRRAAAVDEDEF